MGQVYIDDDELDRGDPEYAEPACEHCGATKEWVECFKCGGEGGSYLCPNCEMA